MTEAPTPLPGTPRTARAAGWAVVLLIGLTAWLQQCGGASRHSHERADSSGVEPPTIEFELTAKVLTKVALAWSSDSVMARTVADHVQDAARTPADRLRAAIVAAELLGPDEARTRLDELAGDPASDPALASDVASVRALYSGGDEPPDAEALEGLKKRHGWFGRVAAARAAGPGNLAHARLVGGGRTVIGLLLLVFGVGGVAVLAGTGLLAAAAIAWRRVPPPTRLVPEPPGGSVLIETVALFVAAFIVLKFSGALVAAAAGENAASTFTLLAQWLLLPVILWPRLRGAPAPRAMRALGLFRGRGVLREALCGIAGWLACLPLLLTGAAVSLALMALWHAARWVMGMPEPAPPSNPVLDAVAGGSPWVVILLFALAAAWAPIVEETVFRGALYGHLRSRMTWPASAILTALAFGLMHGYQLLMLGPVIALGLGFSMMREWRGSIIATMTAHALHNSAVLVLVLTLTRIIGD